VPRSQHFEAIATLDRRLARRLIDADDGTDRVADGAGCDGRLIRLDGLLNLAMKSLGCPDACCSFEAWPSSATVW
jgi:hypothetical protein